MGAIALLALFMLLHASRSSSSSSTPALPPRPSSSTPQSPVARAHEHARRTRQRAAETGKPADVQAANAAAAAAQKATQTQRASSPSPVPNGLPAFPAGWQPDNPPPLVVQQRATQLLPVLWAKGAGATKTEQTAGRWITYQAAVTSPGKKGVVAFRVKPGAMPTAARQPSGNA